MAAPMRLLTLLLITSAAAAQAPKWHPLLPSEATSAKGATVEVDGETFEVESVGTTQLVLPAAETVPTATPAAVPPPAIQAAVGSGVIAAPIPGKVLSLKVKQGDTVTANQVVLILEAMKMENNVHAPTAGTVKEISVGEGSEGSTGQALMVIE